MKACVDVRYQKGQATAACILFQDWTDSMPANQYLAEVRQFEPYIPGQFYRRELPGILSVLDKVTEPVSVILIDGYVWLENRRSPGLGAHLYRALGCKTPVIGVAKNRYKQSGSACKVYRRGSKKPLYVTAVGIGQRVAASKIESMHGKYRIPTMLRKTDMLSKRSDFSFWGFELDQ